MTGYIINTEKKEKRGNRVHLLFLPLLLLLFYNCADKSPYTGFTSSGTGYYYKLCRIGENTVKPSAGDYITVALEYRTIDDSVFFSALRRFRLSEPAFKGSVEECFMMMSKGDSAEFIVPANDFFNRTIEAALPGFIDSDDKMIIAVDMIDIMSEEEYMQELDIFKDHLRGSKKGDTDFEKLLEEGDLHPGSGSSGILYYRLQEGEGKRISAGDTVTIHYEGKFIDGTIFDSTRMRNEPFEYVYGHEGQLIRGLEVVAGLMSEGGKALVYLPPALAFGEKGSSTGIIPPSTPLFFEIEILRVK